MVKTITITNDAYEMLKKMKGKEDSFSKTIIRITGEKRTDLNKFLGILSEKNAEKARKKIKIIRDGLSMGIGKRANVLA